MIILDHLVKSFGTFKAVDDLSLEIKDGEIFGLLGPNGAGKSTTLKMMTGILVPSSGDVFYDGDSIVKEAIKAKKKIGFVPDSPDMFLGMTGASYLAFISAIFGLEENKAKEEAERLAKEFNILADLPNPISSYSHGMRQKIFLIGALIHEPDYWLLDEPLTGLDPESAFKIKNMMREHAQKGHSVLFSTHVLDVAEKICDRIGIIAHGKLLFVGTLDELRAARKEQGESLEELFLELTGNDEQI